ncbi:MAG: hypothetical protein KAW01_01275 [Deltaproteobacteria bacterium]|nr:hypothetical protein [Deltaproteobacteria bacterium]
MSNLAEVHFRAEPLPAKLINSPQFMDIDPVPLPAVYDDWGGAAEEEVINSR